MIDITNLEGGKQKGRIRIMFQNIGGIGNASYQPRKHKLATLKNITINGGISIIGLAEVNSNWSKSHT